MKRAYRIYCLLLFLLMVLVFVCGPHSCEWGNTVYFLAGVAALVFSFVGALRQTDWPSGKRFATGFLFVLGTVVLWCAGFLLGEFRIMCRLF